MKKFLFLLVLSISSLSIFAQVRFIQTNNLSDYETVLNTVKQQEKMIWVAVHEDQGDFRKMYFDGVFKDPQLERMNLLYTPIAINIDGEMGARFTEIFAFTELPTFFIMNQEEFVLAQLSGYQNSSELYNALNEAGKDPYRYDSLSAKYQAGKLTEQEWLELLELYALNFDYNQTSLLALDYLNAHSKDQILEMPGLKILCAYGVDLETPYPEMVLNNLNLVKSKNAAFDHADFLDLALEYNVDLAIANKDKDLLQKALDLFLRPPYANGDSVEIKREFYIEAYAEGSGDFSLYVDFIKEKADAMAPVLAADLLFDEAYAISEDYNLDLSLKSAYKLAQYSDQKQASYRARMLSAYIQYLLEDLEQAQIDLNEAKKLISNSDELGNANKLAELIEEAGK